MFSVKNIIVVGLSYVVSYNYGFMYGFIFATSLVALIGSTRYLFAHHGKESHDTEKLINNVKKILIEKHHNQYYAFDHTNHQFLVQSSDPNEIMSNLLNRFDATQIMIVVDSKELSTELTSKIKS